MTQHFCIVIPKCNKTIEIQYLKMQNFLRVFIILQSHTHTVLARVFEKDIR